MPSAVSPAEERREVAKTLVEVFEQCGAGLSPPYWTFSRGDVDQDEICGKADSQGRPCKPIE